MIDRLDRAGATLLALPHTGHSTRMSQSSLPVVHDLEDRRGWIFGAEDLVLTPTPRAISEMEQALGWIGLIPAERAVLRRIVGARCLCRPTTMRPLYGWRRIAEMVGASHEAVRQWHAQAIELIVAGLNRPGFCHAANGAIGPGPELIRRQIERDGFKKLKAWKIKAEA